MPRNIVLIGYRGCGKTAVANALDNKLDSKIISTDDEIVKKVGKISDFVEKRGWDVFRDVESEVIERIDTENAIIDCGGGVVERKENIENLKRRGIVFWLKASVPVIVERIKNSDRPSLTDKSFVEEVEEVLEKRIPLYEKAADFEIDTGSKTVEDISNEIIRKMKTKICVAVAARTVREAIAQLREAEKLVDLVELRIDFISDMDKDKLRKLLENKTKEVIVTCRSREFKGGFSGSEKERIGLLKHAIELGSDFVDVELGKEIIKDRGQTRVIVSHHNFKETPSSRELEDIYDSIKKLKPDLVKIVTFANSINDNFKIFDLLKDKDDLIAFCMGIRGEMSRILAAKFGSRMTFASTDKGKESAEGQISIQDMESVYNAPLINPKTKVLGVIGEFAENSMSKHMHNPNFKEKKLDFVYMPFKVRKEELKEFMQNFRKFGFSGGAVTVPHKVEIMNYLDDVDETAKAIGAVNTIVERNGKLIGFNTDYTGAVQALKEVTELKDRKVLVIGAGGAARAVMFGLKRENAGVTIVNRTLENSRKLADEFEVLLQEFVDMRKLIGNNDVIVNTTSVGMNPRKDESIIEEKDLVTGKIVMDAVYNPVETKLIHFARKKNCKVITGDRMLVHQAIGQFELWTGVKPDFKMMESSLLKRLEAKNGRRLIRKVVQNN